MAGIVDRERWAKLDEATARRVLLVRAFEERDGEYALVSEEERRECTEQARELYSGDETRLIALRATRVFKLLRDRVNGIGMIDRGDLLQSTAHLGLLILAALVVGVVANPLAGERKISALNFPLLGLVAWNLLVYLWILIHPLTVGLFAQPSTGTRVGAIARWVGERLVKMATALQGEHRLLAGAAFRRYWGLWLRASSKLLQLRAARLLHLMAAALVLGNLAGMYYRGLVVQYEVVWESTFLTESQVNGLLDVLFAPAALAMGQPAPRVGNLTHPAAWFHFSAVTGLLFVLLPRAALTVMTALRIRWLSRALPVELGAPYYRKLLASSRGENRAAVVAAYGHDLPPEAADRVAELLQTLYGARGEVTFSDPLAYGEEATAFLQAESWRDFDGQQRCAVMIFKLDQTPEREVQGVMVRGLREALDRNDLLVLVDSAGWSGTPESATSRRSAWTDEMVRAGVQAIHLDLSDRLPDDVLESCDLALEALWSDALPTAAEPHVPDPLDEELDAWETYQEVIERPGRSPDRIQLSLISHTNLGKTTLARTLLKKDVGRVLDQAHVTDKASAWTLLEADGKQLVLWDTPGFGDTVRLLERFRRQKNAVGWMLNQVWDRVANRALWFNQRTLRHIHEQADVVVYLVKATEDPSQVGYLAPELELIDHFELPVILLLNHVHTTADKQAIETAWREHIASHHPHVRSVLTLDAFTRCWVDEMLLFGCVREVLPEEQVAVMDQLVEDWRLRNVATFDRSAEVIAHFLAQTCLDYVPLESAEAGNMLERMIGKVTDRARQKKAKDDLASRLDQRHLPFLRQLIETQGLSIDEGALRSLREQLGEDFSVPRNTAEEARWITVITSVVSGAATGLGADLLAGGLTFGGGLLAGSLGGLVAGLAIGKAHQMIHEKGEPAVCWSPTFLTAFSRYALLTYVGAAHFGRGKGQFKEAEAEGAHTPWIGAVEVALETHGEALAAQWKALATIREQLADGDADTRESLLERLEHSLLPIFADAMRQVMVRLYPAAEELLPARRAVAAAAPTPSAHS